MTNPGHTVLYTGVTANLFARAYQHREHLIEGFTRRYNATQLVFYEEYPDPRSAIEREKQIKAGPRRKKVELILSMNPEWRDLYEEG